METKHILERLVKEYITTARPVGSTYLVECLDAPVSSATMRHMLHDLEEEGFIYQPHTSAGRIPTDKGYRYYVDHVLAKQLLPREPERIVAEFQAIQQHSRDTSRVTPRVLARLSGTVAISGWVESGAVHEAGWQELVKQPEAQDSAVLAEIAGFMDTMDHYLEELAELGQGGVRVLIGQENQFSPTGHTSWLVRTVTPRRREPIVLVLAGAKRMPYDRHVSLLEGVASILEAYI